MTETAKKRAEIKELPLAQKLNKAIESIGPVKKDGSNNFQNYRFQSEAAIKAAVKKAIALNGFDIIPSYEILGQRDVQGRKGTINHIVDVMGTFLITDGRLEQNIIGKMPGTGMDTGDKATAKACTSAQKYFYKQLFNISDQEEDPDATNSDIGATKNSQQCSYQNNGYQQQRPRQQGNDVMEAKRATYAKTVRQVAVYMGTDPKTAAEEIKKECEKDARYKQADRLGQLDMSTNIANRMLTTLQKEAANG